MDAIITHLEGSEEILSCAVEACFQPLASCWHFWL